MKKILIVLMLILICSVGFAKDASVVGDSVKFSGIALVSDFTWKEALTMSQVRSKPLSIDKPGSRYYYR